MVLSLRGKETTKLHALLSVRGLNNRCTMTNHQQTLKGVMELVTGLIHMYQVWTKEPAVESGLSTIPHSQCSMVPEW